MKKLATILDKWGAQMVSAMEAILRAKGKGNSKLINSLNYKVKADVEDYGLEFFMADYAIFVDKGRRPGKQPPLEVISKWTARKGLPPKAAFPISRNIGKFGLPATNFTQGIKDNLPALIKDLEKNVATEIVDQIKADLTHY